nr:terminase small subunit [Pelosinus baikalensis]
MPYKEIAAKYAVSVETVKSWRKRHGCSRDKTTKKGAPIALLRQQKGCTPKTKGEPEVPEEELSDQELLFCHYYVGRWNATQAAFKAGYASRGNKASAQVIGSRLLARPRVQAELDRLKQLLTQEARITA